MRGRWTRRTSSDAPTPDVLSLVEQFLGQMIAPLALPVAGSALGLYLLGTLAGSLYRLIRRIRF